MRAIQHAAETFCEGRRIQTLRAFRRPQLHACMLGCFDDWRLDWKDWEDWYDREEWKTGRRRSQGAHRAPSYQTTQERNNPIITKKQISHPKKQLKLLENGARLTKMDPGFTKSGAKIEKSALNRPKWLLDGSQDPYRQEVSPTSTNFWVPSGTLKSTKNRSLALKGAPGIGFLSIFFAESVFITFQHDFSSIIDYK